MCWFLDDALNFSYLMKPSSSKLKLILQNGDLLCVRARLVLIRLSNVLIRLVFNLCALSSLSKSIRHDGLFDLNNGNYL